MSEPERAPSGVTPFPLALLLCDDVVTDPSTSKKTLFGVFDRVWARQFPTTHQKLTLYLRLTDAEGHYEFRVDYVQVRADKLLAQGHLPIEIQNRLEAYEIIFTPPPIMIPEPGEYEFRIWANGRYVGRIKFDAGQVPPGPQGDKP